jgi:ribokinase
MVVVFGSINVDLVARVPRLPAAGETLIGEALEVLPGGKGANQALAARRADAAVALYGAVGNDPFALTACANLLREGVDLEGVARVDAPTGTALIHVDRSGENAITVISGANALALAMQVPDTRLRKETVVLAQLEVPIAEVARLAARAHAHGARVVLNAAPASAFDPRALPHVDVLIVNRAECKQVAGMLGLPDDPAEFVRAYSAQHGGAVVVTLGAEGAVAWDGKPLRFRSPPVHAIDTVGAGDALSGAMAAALARGAPLARALSEGIAAGALTCTAAGAQAALPRIAEIQALADTL